MNEESKSIQPENEITTFPEMLPVLPLRGAVAFPTTLMPLTIGQERSIRLINDAMKKDRLFLLVAQKNEKVELAKPSDLYIMGTIVIVHQLVRNKDKSMRLVVQGLERANILEYTQKNPYLMAKMNLAPEDMTSTDKTEPLRRAMLEALHQMSRLATNISHEVVEIIENITDLRQLVYVVASTLTMSVKTQEEILESHEVDAKLKKLLSVIQHEIAVRELGHKITTETRERLSKAQREYFLREQVRSIQKELGESAEQPDLAELKENLEKAHLPEEAKRETDREFSRLSNIPTISPEYGLIRTYLDWMASLPWDKLTGSAIDIHYARQVLDEDHYDLDKIKERIIEYLAVKKLRHDRSADKTPSTGTVTASIAPDTKQKATTPKPGTTQETPSDILAREPILCFVGPPGVGKTSLGQSIARALKRKFLRISLGGMHDEAEIRGHRRTYIGALPGRIIQGIKRAEARDPVYMLDEIDKVGADWRGDPASALLEVLDPAQNYHFMDHYLGVGFDLSQVLFIATANTLDTIPPALLDRMEVIYLSGYTDEEKLRIAQQYLIQKQVKAHGLKEDEIIFDIEGIKHIIRGYTREAGVRNLDRAIANVCRKIARKVAEGEKGGVQVTGEKVRELLGPKKFFDEVAERTTRPGVATGLAWTAVGGEILFIEATAMPTHHESLILTGMLGDVMRESAQAALSYIRSNLKSLKISPKELDKKTIHIHIPEGAIPKDGPSAGVTMVTALTSLFTQRLVRSDIAMTGEITLRGKVLPVGGIKEKVLAAHRAGIKTIILPHHNEANLEDITPELRKEIKFIFVKTIDEVLKHALEAKKRMRSK